MWLLHFYFVAVNPISFITVESRKTASSFFTTIQLFNFFLCSTQKFNKTLLVDLHIKSRMHSFSFAFIKFSSSIKLNSGYCFNFFYVYFFFAEPLGLSYLLGIVGGVLAAFLILFLLCIHVVRTKKCCFKGISSFFFILIIWLETKFFIIFVRCRTKVGVKKTTKNWRVWTYLCSSTHMIEIPLWYLFYLFFINLSGYFSFSCSFTKTFKKTFLGRSTYNTKEKDRYVLWFLLFCLLYWCQKIYICLHLFFWISSILMLWMSV